MGTSATEIVDNLYLVDTVEEAQRIWRANEVIFIEPNYELTLFSTPNDPLFYLQWDMRLINAPAFWDGGFGATSGVRVAFIDSGVYFAHEDLVGANIDPGFNYTNPGAPVLDSLGHGTATTGIVAAVRNNNIGLAGLLDQVRIYPLQVFDKSGSGGAVSYLVSALNDAADVFNVDVINMSLGLVGGAFSQALDDAVNYVASQNIIMVAAVGNDGDGTLNFPAANPNVIGVGAVDANRNVASFSNRNTSVFVVAPGVRVPLLYPSTIPPYALYVYDDGTSFSAPYVTAMAAAARAVRHNITADDFRTLLISTVTDLGAPGQDIYYGWGLIDLEQFAEALPPSNWVNGFRDIYNHWALPGIQYVIQNNLFFGVSSYLFAPDANMTRSMSVTVLGRLYEQMGGTVPPVNPAFPDTLPNVWYSDYVAWAANVGIIQGYDNGLFGTMDPVTREQMMVLFYRFAAYIGLDTTVDLSVLNQFVDTSSIAPWALEAMAWNAERGVITGIAAPGGMALYPAGNSTRAQIATIIQRFTASTAVTSLAA